MSMIQSTSGCFLLALFVGVLLTGCTADALEDDAPRFDMQTQAVTNSTVVVAGDTVVFKRLEFGDFPDLVPVTVTSEPGRIRIANGTYLAGDPVSLVQSSIERNGDEVEIYIDSSWPEDATAAPTFPQGYLYEGQITGLQPGTYRLRLVHVDDALRTTQGGPVTVFDDSVTVR